MFRKEAESPQELAALGRTSILTEEQEKAATMFIASLYGRSCCTSLNSLITEKAASSINIASKKISPTEDALYFHIQCVLYQFTIWRNATIGMHDLPNSMVLRKLELY